MQKRSFYFFILLFSVMGNGLLVAHTVSQKFSNYSDDQGLSRNRLLLGLGLTFDHQRPWLSATAVDLTASSDQYRRPEQTATASERNSQAHNFTVGWQQTWRKTTDTRLLYATSKDASMRSQTGGIGISRWFVHDTLQLAFDVSHTTVKRKKFEILSEESDFIAPPPAFDATGTSLSLKHLSTPTTISQVSISHLETNDRPVANTYQAGIKQFIPMTKSAVHANASRALNRGKVTRASTYGEVSAWILELAYLQALWRGALSRLGYRYYREDETTRVYQDELVRASDAVSGGITQEVGKRTLSAQATKYLTNALDDEGTKVAALIVEVGIGAKF